MKIKWKFLDVLWQKVGSFWAKKPYKTIRISPGHTAIIIPSEELLSKVINGLSDASYYTGIDYNSALNDRGTKIIKN